MLRNLKKLITPIKNWLSLIMALYFSGFVAGVVLLLTTMITLNRIVALSISLLSLIIVGWILLRGPVERMSETDSTRRVVSIIALSITVIALSLVMYRLLLSPAPPYTPIVETPETRYWELATGSKIAYTYYPTSSGGESQLPPVILVHGGPGSPNTMQPNIVEALNDVGFDVYDYHQVGAGLSSRLNNVSEYTVERHVEDLEAIRQSIGGGQIILIGGSWGGQLITNYLAAYHEYVSKAVVSSPSAIWSPAYNDETRLTDSGNQDLHDTIGSYPRIILAYFLMQNLGARPAYALLPDKQIDGVFQHFVSNLDMSPGCSQVPITGNSTRRGAAGVGFWVNAITTDDASQITDPRPALQSVTAPILVLRGECDYIAWEITREYRDILPNAILLPIDNAGHTIETHQPDAYREAIIAFLLDAPLPLRPYLEEAAPW